MKRILILVLIFPALLIMSNSCAQKKSMITTTTTTYQDNKIIPEVILKEAKAALSYFPDLKDVSIEFKMKEDIKKSFMQAQPVFSNLFKGKNDRSYYVFVSSTLKIEDEYIPVEELPEDVLVGWLGHELGHIMDYREKSAMGLIIFGFRYITSKNYIKEAERVADTYAVNMGMGDYILATKDFILNHSHLSNTYKERIARLYLSPEEIVVLVNKLEEDLDDSDKEQDLKEMEMQEMKEM